MRSVVQFLSDPANQWIWGASQTVAIIVGFWFVIRQINLARDQNSISHLNYFRDMWMSDTFLRARLSYQVSEPGVNAGLLGPDDVIANFMNDLALAVRSGQADAKHVQSYFGYFVEGYWLALKPKIIAFRERTANNDFYQHFEFLYDTIAKSSTDRGRPTMQEGYLPTFFYEEAVLARFCLDMPSVRE